MFGGMERMAKDKEDEDCLTIVIGREEDDYIPPKATVGEIISDIISIVLHILVLLSIISIWVIFFINRKFIWILVGTFILLLLISLIKKGIDGPSG